MARSGSPKIDVSGRPVALRDIDLDPFFRPKSVAIVGASDTPKKPTSAMTRKLRTWCEAAGASMYPVNPNRDDVDGQKCYRSIHDVPGDVDLAVILVGDAIGALQDAIERKAKYAVI